MFSPLTESANLRAILDSTNRHISRNPSLCPHIHSVSSVVNVSQIHKGAALTPT